MLKEDRIILRNYIIDYLLNKNILKKISNYYKIEKKSLLSYINDNIEFSNKYILYINEFRSEDEALYCIRHNDDSSNHLCLICNSICSFNKKHGYKLTCGNKECINRLTFTKESIEARKNTNLLKYGVENPMQSIDIKEKYKSSIINKYGVSNPMQSKHIQEKSRATNLKRYGVEYPSQSQIIKDKIIKTNLEKYNNKCSLHGKDIEEKTKQTNLIKYGVKYPLQSKEVIDKVKHTNIDRYGKEVASKSKYIKNKIVETNLERYNIKYTFQLEEVKRKSKDTLLEKYNVENIKQKDITNYDIWIDDEKFRNFIIDEYNRKGMFLTINDIKRSFNITSNPLRKKIDRLNLNNYFYIQSSNLEEIFKEFLFNNNITFVKNNRSLIYNTETNFPLEIDFYCKDYNIGFEINDIATHNSLYKNKYYHYNKVISCENKNVILIHIWEWELRNPIILNKLYSWILSLFNYKDIDYSECEVNMISIKDEIYFVNKYSLEDYKESNICIGLFYKNELISTISFKDDNIGNYKIVSIVNNPLYNPINNSKYLLEYFINTYNPLSILHYCLLDKFIYNNVYKEFNFKVINTIDPEKIFCDKDMNYIKESDNSNKNYISLYNCGYRLYLYKLDS